jgi:biotin transport system substrate-specific component
MSSLSISFERSGQKGKSLLLNILLITSFAALTAIAAKIRIPLPGTPVPMTLQSLAVVLSGAFLGAKRGVLSQLVLIGAGALGLSVFSQPTPGYAVLLGPTGGYILGFLFAAYISGKFSEQFPKSGFAMRNLQLFLASLFIFIPGVIWLKTFTAQNSLVALQMGLFPFLIGDILKTLMASSILSAAKLFRH